LWRSAVLYFKSFKYRNHSIISFNVLSAHEWHQMKCFENILKSKEWIRLDLRVFHGPTGLGSTAQVRLVTTVSHLCSPNVPLSKQWNGICSIKGCYYRAFHEFGKAKLAYGGLILGLSQFKLLPLLPQKRPPM